MGHGDTHMGLGCNRLQKAMPQSATVPVCSYPLLSIARGPCPELVLYGHLFAGRWRGQPNAFMGRTEVEQQHEQTQAGPKRERTSSFRIL